MVVALVADAGTGLGQSVRVTYLHTQQLINEITPDEPRSCCHQCFTGTTGWSVRRDAHQPRRVDRDDHLAASGRVAWLQARRPTRSTSRARSGDTAENHVRYQQHSPLPGRLRAPSRSTLQATRVADAMCTTVATSSRGGGIAVWERQSWWALPATTFRPGTILGSHGHSHTRAINSCQRRESNRSGLPPVRAPGVGGKERGRHWRSPTRRETALRLP